ncbi:MAG: Uma2 family endonuclease [bacterium]
MTLLLVDEKMRPVEGPYEVRLLGWTEERYFAEAPESRFCEFKDGEVIMHSPVASDHQRIVMFLSSLQGYATEKRLGEVLCGPAVLRLRPGLNREPDIVFVDRASEARIHEQYVEGPVPFVVEVLSPEGRRRDLEEKRAEYEEYGVAEYWVVDPFERQVVVHRRGERGFEVERCASGRLECRVVPGFWLDVEWLWRRPMPSSLGCLKEILGEA